MKHAWMVMFALAPAAAAGDQDFYLSVPAQGAIMRVDAKTMEATPFAVGVKIPHYGWFIDGNLYMPDRGWPAVLKIKPDGSIDALSAGGSFGKPVTAIPHPSGNGILLSDAQVPAIFHITWDGTQQVFADAASTNGLLTGPDGMAFDAAGNLYVANLAGDTIIKIDPQGNASLFSDSPLISEPGGLVIDGSGNLFVAMYGNDLFVRFRLDSGEAEVFAADAAKVQSPSDLKLSRSGGLIASTRNSNIVRIHADGAIDVLFHDSTFGDIVGVAVPEDGTLCTGTFTAYGAGKAGSGGFTPELRAIFSPCPGQEIGMEFRNFLGGAPALFFIGLGQANLQFLGSKLLIDPSLPFFMFPIPMPGQGAGAGDLVLPFQVPDNPNLVGIHLYYQALQADPGATLGVSFSNGLHEIIGS